MEKKYFPATIKPPKFTLHTVAKPWEFSENFFFFFLPLSQCEIVLSQELIANQGFLSNEKFFDCKKIIKFPRKFFVTLIWWDRLSESFSWKFQQYLHKRCHRFDTSVPIQVLKIIHVSGHQS
jgi:hypothetical protein